MKNVFALILALAASVPALGRTHYTFSSTRHYSNSGGHYFLGHGSSHRFGHYMNWRTGNHYTRRHF